MDSYEFEFTLLEEKYVKHDGPFSRIILLDISRWIEELKGIFKCLLSNIFNFNSSFEDTSMKIETLRRSYET